MTLGWQEGSVLVTDADPACRQIMFEGPLLEVLGRLSKIPRKTRKSVFVAFPDRKIEPYRLEPADFEPLIRARYRADLRRPVPLP